MPGVGCTGDGLGANKNGSVVMDGLGEFVRLFFANSCEGRIDEHGSHLRGIFSNDESGLWSPEVVVARDRGSLGKRWGGLGEYVDGRIASRRGSEC